MTRINRIELAVGIIVAAIMALCLFYSPARCDDLQDARERLKAIEDAKSGERGGVSPPAFAPTPIPDPISEISNFKSPDIRFRTATASTEITPRLPRAVLVTSQHCSPCERLKRENADLIGGPDAPIQVVQNWLANDLDELGITPGMQIRGTPYLFIIAADGKVHGLTPGGLGCVLEGYHPRGGLLAYLTQPDHGVDITPVQAQEIIADVTDADFTPDTFAAVLSAHLVEVSGQDADPTYTVGGLFDFEFDVNDSWRDRAAALLATQQMNFATAGITIDWTGPARSFSIRPDGISITPPVKVTLNKWMVRYTCMLDGVTYTPDLTRIRLLLTGAPDVTVHLK